MCQRIIIEILNNLKIAEQFCQKGLIISDQILKVFLNYSY